MLGGDEFAVYWDQGIPGDCEVYTWAYDSGIFDGECTIESPPEGSKCFFTMAIGGWAGWGVFDISGLGLDMSVYTNGCIRLWVKSQSSLRVEVEDLSGNKATHGIPATSFVWKLFVLRLSDFTNFEALDFGAIKGLFMVTAPYQTTFCVDDVRWVKDAFHLYCDRGIPAGLTNLTWAGGAAEYDGEFRGSIAPEGSESYLTTGATWVGWGIFADGGADLRCFSNGYMKLWAKCDVPLKIEVEGPPGSSAVQYITSSGGDWQEYQIPMTNFTGLDYSQIYGLFKVTSETGTTFLIDDVRLLPGI